VSAHGRAYTGGSRESGRGAGAAARGGPGGLERGMQEVVIRDADTQGVPLFHPCPPDPSCPYCGGAGPAPAGPDAFDWSFLDGAYCISLSSRPDRAASAAAQFHRLGLCRHVTFHRPTAHGGAPKVGIWEAHRAVGMDALAKGLRAALVTEDDVLFSRRVTPRTVRNVGEALAGLPPGWTIFFLGHWPLRAWFVRRRVLRTVSGCAHAYVASPRLLEWLRDHPYGTAPIVRLVGHGIDAAYAALPGTYAYFPMLATQSTSPSDHIPRFSGRRIKRPKHLVMRPGIREALLSGLMRPSQYAVAALSPVFYVLDRLGGPPRQQAPKVAQARRRRGRR
jgi:hypothetical protein